MMSKTLFDLADACAKKLQKKQGRPEKGIVSTQVQGLIIALGLVFEEIGVVDDMHEKRLIKSVKK